VAHAPLLLLIGLRCSGKTTLGTATAKAVGTPFEDLDARALTLLGCTSITEAFERHHESGWRHAEGRALSEIIVCGGGAFNTALMQRMQALLPSVSIISSAARGLPPQDVEATAFAWLARQCVECVALPLPSVTGARGARILGGIYAA
jgi:1,6-anhydro-N-acetylmuramate kinase